MAKKWYPDLWKTIDINLKVPKTSYGPSETKSFYDPQKPEEGYEVRGVRPTYREIKHPERDSY